MARPEKAKPKARKKKREEPLVAQVSDASGAATDSDSDRIQEKSESQISPLAMRRGDFSVAAERERLLGRVFSERRAGAVRNQRGPRGPEGKTLHHRRLFLTELDPQLEPWPKPDTIASMVAFRDETGRLSFDFIETQSSKRSLETLQAVVRQEDPELLQRYLARSPFSLDGLLVMAEYHRRQGDYEQAQQLIRRAVYTVECSFAPDFSPFEAERGKAKKRGEKRFGNYPISSPQVRLRLPSDEKDESGAVGLAWPGWSCLRALWLHMHALAGQGMHRSALEMSKLLLSMTLPRDPLHVLLWVDHLCLRSHQYRTLHHLSLSLAQSLESWQSLQPEKKPFAKLEIAFPNFAYSVALAGILQKRPNMSALNQLTLEQILFVEDLDEDLLTFARLMRALLYFPACVRPLLEEAGVLCFFSASLARVLFSRTTVSGEVSLLDLPLSFRKRQRRVAVSPGGRAHVGLSVLFVVVVRLVDLVEAVRGRRAFSTLGARLGPWPDQCGLCQALRKALEKRRLPVARLRRALGAAS